MSGKRATICLAVLLACCPAASALDPSFDVSQYAHSAWKIRDGAIKGAIRSIAQTTDGYLWIGTETGLLRFDGARMVTWHGKAGDQLPSEAIVKLLGSRDGRLWIGTREGLASLQDGRLKLYPEMAGTNVLALVEDSEGAVWAGNENANGSKLCSIDNTGVHCYGGDGRFGLAVNCLYEDRSRSLWVGATTGFWRWRPGPPRFYPMPEQEPEVQSLVEGDDGALLISLQRFGMRQLIHEKLYPYAHPGSTWELNTKRLLRDREGSLWVGTVDRGLVHVHNGRTDVFSQSDGLSSNYVWALFEDREGSIWAGSFGGLDCFRETSFRTISEKQGLSGTGVPSVLADREGNVWLGTANGLDRWKDGQIVIYRRPDPAHPAAAVKQTPAPIAQERDPEREIDAPGLPDNGIQSLLEDKRGRLWVATHGGVAYFEQGRFTPLRIPSAYVFSMAEDTAGDIWLVQDLGLFHLHRDQLVEQIPWAHFGHKDTPYVGITDSVHGGLWLGFEKGGVLHFRDHAVQASYTSREGLAKGMVWDFHLEHDGTLWVAASGGLSRIKDGRVSTLTAMNGLPCAEIKTIIEDDAHALWLHLPCGLARISRQALDQWINSPTETVQMTIFDSSDGILGVRGTPYSPHAAKSKDGRLWFLPVEGASVIDPKNISLNRLPPPVHIEEVKADGKAYDASRGLHLPALVRDVWIDYTALTFGAPEKVHFRYKLEGQDPDWKEVVNNRQAQYSNLAPRNYRFRVMACNNSGVWNEAGDSLEFSIVPAYYQTGWFRASCVAAVLALLWGLYRYRLHQIAQAFNANLEGRVDERLRVARELHDTLLQSFQGLMLHFQIGVDRLPPSETKEVLEKALEVGDRAIVEGREAIHDLRSSTVVENDLAKALRALGDELATGHSATFRLIMEGPSRNLHPILRDEIYRIAREAVRNAFNHSQASHIEAEIHYGEKLLRLRIRDDGRGIDPNIVAEGRTGHYGLPGMRERARNIGGQLKVWTATGAGTEIDLTIPASIAYGTSLGRRTWWHRLQPVQSVPPKEES